jgi:hypothetical protein
MYLVIAPFIIAGLSAKLLNARKKNKLNTSVEHSNQETEIEYILQTFENQLNSTDIWGSLIDAQRLFKPETEFTTKD